MIFLIDDDQYVRRGFGMLLRSANYKYTLFASVEEFLENSTPASNDLIILDYHLPGMNGCKLLEYFTENNMHFPVIIITAFDDQVSRDCAKKYGALAYLRKPVDGEALIDLIKYSFTKV